MTPGRRPPVGLTTEQEQSIRDALNSIYVGLAPYRVCRECDVRLGTPHTPACRMGWFEWAERERWALQQRADTLEREVCTCPWPADAAVTRHLLSCRLMQMEHAAIAREEKPND